MNHPCRGDNLAVLRDRIRDEGGDLIDLDPPFNSSASYDVLLNGPSGSESAEAAYTASWSGMTLEGILGDSQPGGSLIRYEYRVDGDRGRRGEGEDRPSRG